jgi:D-glycero-alpha-D-manno-heptose 1-phosphate guanylyltransferase
MLGEVAPYKPMSLPAIILCGGMGTRLSSVVSDRPKSLAEVAGRPFIAWLLDQLESGGIEEVVLATGYKGEQVRETFGAHYRDIRLCYSQEAMPLGTAGALYLAAQQIPGADCFLVMNGDSYCHMQLHSFVQAHQGNRALNSMVVTTVDDMRRFGSVHVDEKGFVRGFREKDPDLRSDGAGLINAGVYLVSRALIESIPQGRSVSLESEIFPLYLDGRLRMWKASGPFIDIGTPASFAEASGFFAKSFA